VTFLFLFINFCAAVFLANKDEYKTHICHKLHGERTAHENFHIKKYLCPKLLDNDVRDASL